MKTKSLFLPTLLLATLLWQGCNQRTYPLTMPDNTILTLQNEQEKRAEWLVTFYRQYLELSCYRHWDDSLSTAYSALDSLMKISCSDNLYTVLYSPTNTENIEWLDYDILIQGQDCWPGIVLKEVKPVGDSYWMEATICYESDTGNSAPEHIYLYVDNIDEQFKLWSIEDRYSQVGHAPQKLKAINR